jgi:hypothetical protein
MVEHAREMLADIRKSADKIIEPAKVPAPALK